MLRISQLKLSVDHTEEELRKKVAHTLQIKEETIRKIRIIRQSLDARKKPSLFYVYTIDVEAGNEKQILKNLMRKKRTSNVQAYEEKKYRFPKSGEEKLEKQPVIVGCGPAGLFCAYFLASSGYRPILLEQGAPVEERQKDVEEFWKTGVLKPDSNVQFGEGGAGTFSDGKLNTLIKDPIGRNKKVLEIFVENGAPEEITYVNKPHIGTDILRTVIRNMREQILAWGGEIHFHTKMTDLVFKEDGGSIQKICCQLPDGQEKKLETDVLVLALGHSARDTFKMLYERKLPMEPKSFAVGVRAEHPQKLINNSQYGDGEHALPAAAYKLTAKLPDGRGVYSFCMCPGGYVVNASSEEGLLAVNGMSYYARDSKNANSAIVVTVTPDDFGSDHPLAGIEFQRRLEKAAYEAGQGRIPVQRYGDFYEKVTGEKKAEEESKWYENHMPCMKGMQVEADISGIFPGEISRAIVDGMEDFNKKIRGFSHSKALLSGVESRTSSPVRIVRDSKSLESAVAGIYPCGEGAGYAGGITSAAADGIKIAEMIRQKYCPFAKKSE